MNAGHVLDFHLLLAAAQTRISRQDGAHVSRHVNLGDNLHPPRAGVRHDVTYLGLRIKSAIRAPVRLLAPGADLVQPWKPQTFQAISLVVAQMPVQTVQFPQGTLLNHALYGFHVEKMAAGINQDSAIPASGRVRKGSATARPAAFPQHPIKRRQAVRESFRVM